jgi:hypothetical protein
LHVFSCWKFKQIAKIGFGRENQLSPQCVHTAEFRNFNSENVKNKNCVHTWANGIGYTSVYENCRRVSMRWGLEKLGSI